MLYTIVMAKQKLLKNPPIREAVLDIRVVLPDDFDLKKLEEYHNFISKEYPVKQVSTLIETAFEFQKDKSATFSSKGAQNGYIFKTQTNNKIIQFRRDGFTFNKIRPYTNWEEFSGEAQKHWESYLKITQIKLINRIALRYINVIPMPLAIKDFKEYILTVPEIAPTMPQSLREFFMRLVIPEDGKTNNIAIITETIDIVELKSNPSVLPLIFDIDVFNKSITQANTDLIWESLNGIRNYKNRIFFESLTDKAIKLFEI